MTSAVEILVSHFEMRIFNAHNASVETSQLRTMEGCVPERFVMP